MRKFSYISILVCVLVCSFEAFGMGKSQPEIPRLVEVAPGKIYRGGQPSESGFQILVRDFKIRTVLSVRDEDQKQIDWEKAYVESLGMNFISIPMSGFTPPNDWDMMDIEAILESPKYYPVFVHCQYGRDRTGLVIGLYRVFHDNYSPARAYQEMIDLGFRPSLYALYHYFVATVGYSP